jgi:hypothetical protein
MLVVPTQLKIPKPLGVEGVIQTAPALATIKTHLATIRKIQKKTPIRAVKIKTRKNQNRLGKMKVRTLLSNNLKVLKCKPKSLGDLQQAKTSYITRPSPQDC